MQNFELQPESFYFSKCQLLHPFQGSGHIGPFLFSFILLQRRNKKNQLFTEFCSVTSTRLCFPSRQL